MGINREESFDLASFFLFEYRTRVNRELIRLGDPFIILKKLFTFDPVKSFKVLLDSFYQIEVEEKEWRRWKT